MWRKACSESSNDDLRHCLNRGGGTVNVIRRLSILTSSLLLGQCAFAAGDLPRYIWSNSHGFISSESCKTGVSPDIDFRVDESSATTATATAKAKFIAVSDAEKQNPKMADPGDFVLELNNQNLRLSNKKKTRVKSLGSTHFSLAKSFWQVAMTDNQFDILTCGNNQTVYAVFNVYVAANKDAVAQVGVSAQEASILKQTLVYSPNDAEKAIVSKNKPTPVFATIAATSPQSAATVAAQASAAKPTVAPAVAAPGVVPVAPSPAAIAARPTQSTGPVSIAATQTLTPAEAPPATSQISQTPVQSGTLEYVLCTAQDAVQVYDQTLKKVIFDAQGLVPVKPFQAFGAEAQTQVVKGKATKYIEVQFTESHSGQDTGWVDASLVTLTASCKEVAKNKVAAKVPAPEKPAPKAISGLTDDKCCTFPTIKRPVESYLDGQRRFRASRENGNRLHAACDLYRPHGEAVRAVADGKIVRGKYYFYEGVYAIEVRHTGGFIARYGEVLGRNAANTKEGTLIKAGQTIGYVGTVNSGCCDPMLHFELYSGKAKGRLTQDDDAGFERRSDLMNPTPYLQKWEHAAFGTSY